MPVLSQFGELKPTSSSLHCSRLRSVGNLIGTKDVNRARTASSAGMIIALLSAAVTSTVLVLTRHKWPKLYTDDAAVATLVSSVTPVIVLHQFSTALSQVGSGHLRLQGNQFIAAIMNISGYFIFGMPLGLWLAFRYDFGLFGLWIGITTGLVLQSAGLVAFWFRTDWSKEVLRAAERNSREDWQRKLMDEEDQL
ncbi:hypothetical protein C0992_011046 [Termitomyces sp. T32_za158]|nr:hypothetical protein C0992_011046 [Termitomyces sp. T32_za158]